MACADRAQARTRRRQGMGRQARQTADAGTLTGAADFRAGGSDQVDYERRSRNASSTRRAASLEEASFDAPCTSTREPSPSWITFTLRRPLTASPLDLPPPNGCRMRVYQ